MNILKDGYQAADIVTAFNKAGLKIIRFPVNIITPQNVVNFEIVGYNKIAGGDGFESVFRDNKGRITEKYINAKTI